MTDVYASGENHRALAAQWGRSDRDAERERRTLPDSPYTREEHRERQAIAFGRAWLDEQCRGCGVVTPEIDYAGCCEQCRSEGPCEACREETR